MALTNLPKNLISGMDEMERKPSHEEHLFKEMQKCIVDADLEDGLSVLLAFMILIDEREMLESGLDKVFDSFHNYIEEVSKDAQKLLTYLLGRESSENFDSAKIANLLDLITITEDLNEYFYELPDSNYFSHLRALKSCLSKAGFDTAVFDSYMNQMMTKLEGMKASYRDGAEMLTYRKEDLSLLFQLLSFSKLVDILVNGLDCIINHRELRYELLWMTEQNPQFLLSLDYQDIDISGILEIVTQLFRELIGDDECPF